MPGASGIIVMHHGLITWARNPKAAYAKTIEIVSMVEKYLTMKKSGSPLKETREAIPKAIERFKSIAPVLRGLLAPNVDPDQNTGIILKPLINDFITSFMNLPNSKQLALTSPLTPDYLIRTKTLPLWIDGPQYDDIPAFHDQLIKAITTYAAEYKDYVFRHLKTHVTAGPRHDAKGRAVTRHWGRMLGRTDDEAAMVCGITQQALEVKRECMNPEASIRDYRKIICSIWSFAAFSVRK